MMRALEIAGNTFAAKEIKEYLKPGPSPMDREPAEIAVGSPPPVTGPAAPCGRLCLDGMWSIAGAAREHGACSDYFAGCEGSAAAKAEKQRRLTEEWPDGVPAKVPGSIYTALFEAGVIPDPYVGRNDALAMEESQRAWFCKRTFSYSGSGKRVMLQFDGVCDRCEIYLNGTFLGTHQGMFGGPFFDVSHVIRQGENTLLVYLLPAIHFNNTVVFNCSDGWHYARIWPLGIWNSVTVTDLPEITAEAPFVTTVSHEKGTLDVHIDLINNVKENDFTEVTLSGAYQVTCLIRPKNFTGTAAYFTYPLQPGRKGVTFEGDTAHVRLRFDMPDFRLWWPNGSGAQHLYTMTATIERGGAPLSEAKTSFGIRTLKMEPYPSGEREDMYNRKAVINGRGIFLKGAGWCTIDALMRFTRPAYDRILSRTKQEGLNFFRAWGGGLTETEDFYELCDAYGICVYQEWPCCWDSHKHQPPEALYETIRINAKRIRNHPSLILYGGGNEGIGSVEDAVLNVMGKLTYEYDGTRIFYRQDGGVGGRGMTHDHIHWGGESPEHYITRYGKITEVNLHEYGLDAFMSPESVAKYASPAERMEWPVAKDGVVAYHTATFNGMHGWNPTPYGYDVDTYLHYAGYFLKPTSIVDLAVGSQLAQAMAKYPAVLNSRIKWPSCTAVCYYKMNDVFPGGSWSTVDWYGTPKIAHYLCQDAQAPLMAGGLFDRYNTYDKEEKDLTVPIYLLDDNGQLGSGQSYAVSVRAYDGGLRLIREQPFAGTVGASGLDQVTQLGTFHLTEAEAGSMPLLIVTDLFVDGKMASRIFMPLNFDRVQGSLLGLPKTSLTWQKVDASEFQGAVPPTLPLPAQCRFAQHGIDGDLAYAVTNTGAVPAVGVHILCPMVSDHFTCDDNYFWLEPGETKLVRVSGYEGVDGFVSFNDPGTEASLSLFRRLQACAALPAEAVSETCSSLRITWQPFRTAGKAEPAVLGYNVYLNGTRIAGIPAEKAQVSGAEMCAYLCEGLAERGVYTVQVAAVNRQMEEFAVSSALTAQVLPDMTPPSMLRANLPDLRHVRVFFSKRLNPASAENIGLYTLKTSSGAEIPLSAAYPEPPRSGETGQTVLLTAGDTADFLLCETERYVLEARGITDSTAAANPLKNSTVAVCPGLCYNLKTDGSNFAYALDSSGTHKAVCLTNAQWDQTAGEAALSFVPERSGVFLIRDSSFSIGSAAAMTFDVKVRPRPEYRVLFAKNGKGRPGHFEFYLRPDGELMVYSQRGDHALGVKLNDGDAWYRLEFRFRAGRMEVYCNGGLVCKGQDWVVTDETVGDLAIGSLTDGSLRFDGWLRNVTLRTWCGE